MELINIKISRRPELISGIKIKEGNQWILINQNPVDYVLDGYSYINKKYLKNTVIVSEDNFTHKVLTKKYNDNTNLFSQDALETFKSLLLNLVDASKLIEFEFESSDYCIIGKIARINEKSFAIKKLSTKAEFLGEESFKIESLRIISTDTDYLNALEAYLV